MIETTTKCDVCKQAVDNTKVFILQIDSKMHDLCEKCHGTIRTIFANTGRDAPVSLPFILNQQEQYPYTNPLIQERNYLYSGPMGVGSLPGNYQNSDMGSMPGGLQYTLTSDVRPVYSMSQQSVLARLAGFRIEPV